MTVLIQANIVFMLFHVLMTEEFPVGSTPAKEVMLSSALTVMLHGEKRNIWHLWGMALWTPKSALAYYVAVSSKLKYRRSFTGNIVLCR